MCRATTRMLLHVISPEQYNFSHNFVMIINCYSASTNQRRTLKEEVHRPFWSVCLSRYHQIVYTLLSCNGFNFDGIDAPTPIKKVEKQNEMAINVFGYERRGKKHEEKSVIVYRLSERSSD